MLSDNFIEKYKNKTVPFGGNGLGELVYLRTYARWLPELGRREEWYETVRRVVDYNMGLHLSPYKIDQDLNSEAESLFDDIFNLKVFPAGRTLWIGGTEAAKKFPLANFNCSFRVVDGLDAFTQIFYLLMLGCGTGFRVLPKDVEQLPQLRTDIEIRHVDYIFSNPDNTQESTSFTNHKNGIVITVGDSKEGWVNALSGYFSILENYNGKFDFVDWIEIDYNNVRPAGSVLKTFGGRASGPAGLLEMFANIHRVVSSSGKLRSIDALDIMNIIAYNVVVGGVRRSSQIALFDINDIDILDAKKDLYTKGSINFGKNWRAMSNNSVFFTTEPTKKQLLNIFERIEQNGEPGFVNAVAASERRPNFQGINPCAEILLDSKGVCNLTEVNLNAFVHQTDYLDYYLRTDLLLKAIKNAVRVGLRQTNVTLELPDWDEIQKRDRLIGVSLTGVEDAFDKLNLSDVDENDLLSMLSWQANEYAQEYAKQMRIPEPLLVTTVKPSGTISQLPTVSSGVHRSFAPYYIRRVRVTASDPIATVMLNSNYPVFPETGQGPNRAEFLKLWPAEQLKALSAANTWVVEFPVKTATILSANEEDALEQFRRYLTMQNNWTNHNTSITIYFAPDEVEDLVDNILHNWDKYIAISFLPKNTTHYNLIPYEEITEKEYNKRVNDIIDRDTIKQRLNDIENGQMDDDLDPSCATGICPVR